MARGNVVAPVPSFFILGASKCGTTTLDAWLRQDPGALMATPKEPHFFDVHYAKGLEAYRRDHFPAWAGQQAVGEASPSYLCCPHVPVRIAHDAPDARLIALVRNPVDRAFSSWWMYRRRGSEPLSFRRAVLTELASGDPFDADPLAFESRWQAHWTSLDEGGPGFMRVHVSGGHYAEGLRRYLSLFPRERLRVFFFEDLQRRPDWVLREALAFVGVNAASANFQDLAPHNQAEGMLAPGLVGLARRLGIVDLYRRLPDRFRLAIRARFLSSPPPHVRESDRRLLIEHYEPHNRALEKLLNVDLSAWRRAVQPRVAPPE